MTGPDPRLGEGDSLTAGRPYLRGRGAPAAANVSRSRALLWGVVALSSAPRSPFECPSSKPGSGPSPVGGRACLGTLACCRWVSPSGFSRGARFAWHHYPCRVYAVGKAPRPAEKARIRRSHPLEGSGSWLAFVSPGRDGRGWLLFTLGRQPLVCDGGAVGTSASRRGCPNSPRTYRVLFFGDPRASRLVVSLAPPV